MELLTYLFSSKVLIVVCQNLNSICSQVGFQRRRNSLHCLGHNKHIKSEKMPKIKQIKRQILNFRGERQRQ